MKIPLRCLLCVLLFLGACAPRPAVREPVRTPADPAPLEQSLLAYNRAPGAVRLEGRLRIDGLGTADFGARVRKGVGMRLDAVGGPFSTPVLSLACLAGPNGLCEVYLPTRRTAYRQEPGAGSVWLEALLRGRVHTIGTPQEAWNLSDGRRLLVILGDGGWRQEVFFLAGSDLPSRVVLIRDGESRLEMTFREFTEVGGHPFPTRVALRTPQDDGGYGFHFRRVVADSDPAGDAFSLVLPPGTEVETLSGGAEDPRVRFPFWLPAPPPPSDGS
ncbi:MAG: hypothetical protein SCH98_01520 [Deferrisomatales bacterium]|nr:hypothetical protein [Deferrisomatales bacterium]